MISLNKLQRNHKVTAQEYNVLVDSINRINRIRGSGGITVRNHATGIDILGLTGIGSFSVKDLASNLKMMEVQKAGLIDGNASDGIYTCRQKRIIADEWIDTAGTDKLEDANKIETWAGGRNYRVDDILFYNTTTWGYYICIKNHVSAVNNAPDSSVWDTYWQVVYDWKFATVAWSGATNYIIKNVVISGGKHYVSLEVHINSEPPSTAWKEMWKLDDWVWTTVNDEKRAYKCLVTHVPAEANEPPEATKWIDPYDIEVFNLQETFPAASYTPALFKLDIMLAFPQYDDEGNKRWVGLPQVPQVRRLRTAAAAGGNQVLLCNAILRSGVEAIDGELGYNITVNALVSGGANLNSAIPRLADDDYIAAYCEYGTWYFSMTFQKSGDC